MRRAAAMLVVLALAGCATFDAPPVSAPPPPAAAEPAPSLAAYVAQLRGMSEAQLAAEAASEGNSAEMKEMAGFLHVQAVERRRLRESAAVAEKSLREERKATEAQKQRAEALQERVAQLQQKLDALGEIEKSLSGRETRGR